jgi:hypothetical protein
VSRCIGSTMTVSLRATGAVGLDDLEGVAVQMHRMPRQGSASV